MAFAPARREGAAASGAPSMAANVLLSFQLPDAAVVRSHAFSRGDGERLLAASPGTKEIQLWERCGEGWDYSLSDLLVEHEGCITGLDWSCSGRLVSVADDRTALVWQVDAEGAWHHMPVELKAPRAATCVLWSASGERFAAGLQSREVALCSYNALVNSWVAKKVGTAAAAVRCVAWHPKFDFLAAGSMDCHCRVYNVNADDEDFGKEEVDEDAGAWLNTVAFSSTGRVLAFATQDSAVSFKDLTGGPDAPLTKIRWRGLPFLSITFVGGDRELVACGYDCAPVLFRCADGVWEAAATLDASVRAVPAVVSATAKRDSFEGARAHFRSMASQGSRGSIGGRDDAKEALASYVHSNTITNCTPLVDRPGCFATSGLDGQIVMWSLAA